MNAKAGKYLYFKLTWTRSMPKRPCAVVVTPDGSTILCADKFGDVYSLPLMGQNVEPDIAKIGVSDGSASQTNKTLRAPFTPSATSSTVHTKRNREALRQQQMGKNLKVEKKSLNFDHQLLLGHVSLLTDVVCAVETLPNFQRNFILTADRDEHIRVSRGIPQSHIVEGYCLGHTEFVSKLCILPPYPHLLLSGGGDGYLLLWNWRSGTIQQRIDLSGQVQSFKTEYSRRVAKKTDPVSPQEEAEGLDNNEDKIAVTNIKFVQARSRSEVIVTCEGYVVGPFHDESTH